MKRLLLVLVSLAAVGCGVAANPGRPWSLHVGGERSDLVSGEAVAVARDGDIAVVWSVVGDVALGGHRFGPHHGEPPQLVLARYDAERRIAWAIEVAAPECGARPSFAPVVRFAPDGGIVVAANPKPGGSICVLGFAGDGRRSWARQLALVGMPRLGIDSAGQIAITGAHAFSAAPHAVVAVSPRGALSWQAELAFEAERLCSAPAGTIAVIGHASEGVAVRALSSHGEALWQRVLPQQGGAPNNLYLAVDDTGALYAGWTERAMTAFTLELEKLAADGSVGWSRAVPQYGVAIVEAGPAGLALAMEGAGHWSLATWDGDGTARSTRTVGRTLVTGKIDGEGLDVVAIAVVRNALIAVGWAAKAAVLGAAGGVATACVRVGRSDHGDPPRTIYEDRCGEAGWLARFPL